MSKGTKLKKKGETVVAPQAAIRVTVILTAEMIRLIGAHAELARTESGGVLLNPNRSDAVRRIVGLHYRIPEERWATVGPQSEASAA